MPRAKTPDETHSQSVSISFTPDELKRLVEYCQKRERPMSWVIRKALDEYIPRHEDDPVS